MFRVVLYESLKLLHILLAIIAVGANFTYGYWMSTTASVAPEALGHVLRRIRALDRYIANPSYGLLLLTGAALVQVGLWNWGADWIVIALIMWLIAAGIGTGAFLPAIKKQIEALDRHGFQSQTYKEAAKQTNLMGMLNMVPVVIILVMMVFKFDGWI